MSYEVKVETKTKSDVVNIALEAIKKGKQVIVFAGTKKSAEKTSEDISKKIKLNFSENEFFQILSEKALNVLGKPTKQCERLAKCIKKGSAFHHAGLTGAQRELIEDNFRAGKIKVICSTPTLAYGLDLPAYRVIIKDLKRYSDIGFGGMNWIPVLEYLQMAGRAGRPKFEKTGEAVIIANDEKSKEEIYEKYVLGEPEEIISKLAVEPVLRTYVLSLISTGFVNNKKELLEFFSKTFWAHQYEDMQKLEEIMDRIIQLLDDYEFIQTDEKDDFVSADSIKTDEKLRATLLGKRVAQLYVDPLTANHIITCLKSGVEKKRVTSFGLLQTISHTIEMRPLLRIKTREYEEIQEKYVKYESEILEREPDYFDSDYDDYLNSVKTALFFNDWIAEKDEEFLLEEYNMRPGETRMKLGRADWLLYCSEEIAKLLSFQSILSEIQKLRFRIKYGVQEELLALLQLKNVGRVRARILHKNGIKDLGGVKRIDIGALAQLLGRKIAIDIKQQVGEDVDKLAVPERKRKGQISLNDFCK
ncbi:hypothetical protein HN587_07165 [Candidatus Woesearchaeota archaeon]|mgnify:CR=1 FL=1|jgi:helicase|nr:hypothetical protein [Candidatus Woesearchaeota archaeon]